MTTFPKFYILSTFFLLGSCIDIPGSSALALDFVNDIVPVLTKAGCNAGSCHGAAIGRGGFKLSLYGGDPKSDFESIVYQLQGRRINKSNPQDSLILRKPTEQISHEGGTLFDLDSESAQRILTWIQDGATFNSSLELANISVSPERILLDRTNIPIDLTITAHYSNGLTRDVTRWSVLTSEDESAVQTSKENPTVKPIRNGRHIVTVRYLTQVKAIEVITPLVDIPAEIQIPASKIPNHNFIDNEINQTLETLKLQPAGQASDSEFLRRVYLDLTGRLPAVPITKSFLASNDPNKRHALIRSLLASPEYTEFWSYRFANLLRLRPQSLGEENSEAYFEWIQSHVAADTSIKDFARTLILAKGDSRINGPANFYRTTTDARQHTEFTSELFLGTRLRCANCHNHPLDKWTQDDYHGLAAIFAKVDLGEEIRIKPEGTSIHPRTSAPAVLRIPGSEINLSNTVDPRIEFANWLTAEDNPYFARAFVNRLWKLTMGRGLVAPVDDFRDTNPATHPELLTLLADDFVDHGYSVRHTLARICESAAYQRTARSTEHTKHDNMYYSRALRVPLDAAVHADAVSDVLGLPERYGEHPLGTRAIHLLNPLTSSRSLDILGRCDRSSSCDDPAAGPSPLSKLLHFFNGEFLNGRLNASGSRLQNLLAEGVQPKDIIKEYYLAAYSRFPTQKESEFWLAELHKFDINSNRDQFLEDFVWSLMTSRDFITNH